MMPKLVKRVQKNNNPSSTKVSSKLTPTRKLVIVKTSMHINVVK